jgi:Zn-dependent alcohol dehydrogenase
VTDARVVVLRDYGFLGVEEVSLPQPGVHQVEVEVWASGIQPAQRLLVAATGRKGDQAPVIPGLEGVGVVTGVGHQTTRVNVGDAVVIGPTSAMGLGRAVNCPRIDLSAGTAQTDRPISMWATNVVVDERFVTPVRTHGVKDREKLAVLGDSALSAVAAAAHAARSKHEAKFAVVGCGAAGLAAVSAARALGAGAVTAVAGARSGLEMAKTANATELLHLKPGEKLDLTGFDRVIVCLGELSDELLQQLSVSSASEIYCVASVESAPQRDAWTAAAARFGAALFQSLDRDRDIAMMLDWMTAGSFEPAHFVSRRYTIEQINEAVLETEGCPAAGQPLLILEPLR